jgi:glycosyltransferase involved in cell wall biosynthesis
MVRLGLNLHVYRAPILNESRLERFSKTLQATGYFDETHIVGSRQDGLSHVEDLGNGRRIVRLSSQFGRRLTGPVAKALGVAAWSRALLRTYKHEPVRIVAAHWIWGLPVCWLLARRTGAQLVYNAHELETETPTMRGVKKIVAVLLERVFVPRCALMTVVNPSIADWYRQAGVRSDAVSVRNIPDVAESEHTPDLRGALEVPPEALLFIHTGRLVGGRYIPQILAAFEGGARPHHVVFLGDGPLENQVTAATARCPRVHHLPAVPAVEVVAHVRGADVGLCLIDTSALSYAYSSPNKLFEALAAQRPVLCTDLVEARRLIGADFDTWLVRDPVSDLEAVIGRIDVDAVRRAANAQVAVRLPPWTEEAEHLVEAYSRLLVVEG